MEIEFLSAYCVVFPCAYALLAARAVTLNQLAHDGDCSPRDKVVASSIGGGVAGTLGGMLSKCHIFSSWPDHSMLTATQEAHEISYLEL